MSTNTDPLEPLAAAIADRVWAHLQDRIAESASVQMINVPEAAKRIGIGKTKLHEMIASGEFPRKAVRNVGRRVLIVTSEMDRWVSAR